jgi:hypothetical protein
VPLGAGLITNTKNGFSRTGKHRRKYARVIDLNHKRLGPELRLAFFHVLQFG